MLWLIILIFSVYCLFNVSYVRQKCLSLWLFKLMRKALPAMSQTEREALEAGNVWWDAELFSGRPNWQILQQLHITKLTLEEQAFIDGPVETLCEMLNDWEITHNRKDLPDEVWAFIKQHKFCGMIIPKEYGGLDFSNSAHSEVVMKISSRSVSAAVTIMVPNSLGPAKLLLAYGTEQQKNYYLPRLANGEEIPAFALTGPYAGSDAGSMRDTGIICYGQYQGQDTLGIRLNWEKRYITLGPIATVLGLAFKLYDPQHLLGEQENLGITLALIPTNTPGINIGRRHYPLNSAFQNGPNWGKDVFIPLDWVIGGVEQLGNGWKMLMQCLSTGRAISLPALSVGAAKFACRNCGAYARIRKQFNVSLGEFEGIEEVLARMAGETYILDAARKVTCAALDQGEKPAVISAILKYELTERMRRVVNDGMDILGGAGICLGPRNYLGRLYQVIPISITVEGANILTRSMMIFGQGAIRCHPYLKKEMDAIEQDNLKQFDEVVFQHLKFLIGNLFGSLWLGLTHSRFLTVPANPETRHYYQQIARLSCGFALLTDCALILLGGSLKRRERISGRFADVLSNLYLCSSVLKYYQAQGSHAEEQPLLHWACQQTIYRAQQSLLAIFWKLPYQPIVKLIRTFIFPTGKPYSPPSDKLIHEVAKIAITDNPVRDRLTTGIYINSNIQDAAGRIEIAFQSVLAALPIEEKLKSAQRSLKLAKGESIETAVAAGVIMQSEANLLAQAEQAMLAAITVDDFEQSEI